MSMKVSVTAQELSELITLHLGEFKQLDPLWEVSDSQISGRGVFARHNIKTGEEIFREHSLLVGPTAQKSSNLKTCTICYHALEAEAIEQLLCPICSLPVCAKCAKSERHALECKLFRGWKPKNDHTKIERGALRLLSIVRCLFLNDDERKLLYAMQANADKYYLKEIANGADCFQHFPTEPEILKYFQRTICAFNTNAFEGRSKVEGNDIKVRALFPLAGTLNHNCTPNAGHHFEDAETIVVCATRNIAIGEEITTSYTKILWSTLARKLFLGMTKHFICQCQRCLDPTVLRKTLSEH